MGEAKRRKRYLRAIKYAEECGIAVEIALRRIKAFDLADINYKKAKKCPSCGLRDLIIDSTDYEYRSNEYWVWCSECGYTSDIAKKYEPLQYHYGMDIVGALSNERGEQFGDGWEEFVLKDTFEIEEEYGAA